MPANNNTPIATETKVRKLKIDEDLSEAVAALCDNMGAAGYLLSASFVLDGSVILVFQRTR